MPINLVVNKNQSGSLDLNSILNLGSNGDWTIVNNSLVHNSNIASYISKSLPSLTLNKIYRVTYTAINYGSCQFRVYFGSTAGTIRSANGVYTENLLLSNTNDIKFWSSGEVTITSFKIEDIQVNNTELDLNDTSLVENNSWTLSYNPILDQWVSFHSYIPNNYLISNNKLLTKNNLSQIKVTCSGPFGQYFDNNIKPFIIETIINDYKLETKIFDNITINLTSISIDGTSSNKFFDNMILYTEYQCSGKIELNTSNLTKKERNWMINKFNDLTNASSNPLFVNDWNNIKNDYPIDKVINDNKLDYSKPWFQRARLRDKFLSIRFIENNLDNQKLIINFVSSVYRKSQR